MSIIYIFINWEFCNFSENRVQNDVALAPELQNAANDGNVEAIAEAYPEDSPAQDPVLYDSEQQTNSNKPNINDFIPSNVAPVLENDDRAVVIQEEPVAPTTLASTTTTTAATTAIPVVPKKKVHIALDIPDASTSDDDEHDDIDDYPTRPQKPNRPNKGQSPTYTYFPLNFGRTAGGTVAIANAYSTGKGAVRSHAIAYGTSSGLSRQQAARRHISNKEWKNKKRKKNSIQKQ